MTDTVNLGAPKKEFRPDIEGLRGVAILLVVLYHTRILRVTGGYIGVDVFFVISGYLITGLLTREMDRTGRIGFFQFYARRARRLLPAVGVMLLVILIAGLFLLGPSEQIVLEKTALFTSVYGSNIKFIRDAADYLAADAADNPLLHTWSLAVEEQFYLVWPAVVFLGLYGLRNRTRRRRLYSIIAAVAILSFLLNLRLVHTRQPLAFFGSPARSWEFAVGGLASVCAGRFRFESWRVLPWAGMAAIIGAGLMFTNQTAFPGYAALLPVIGSAGILIYHTHQTKGGVLWLLGNPAMQYLGRLSYSWYLWHWPVLVFASTLMSRMSLASRVLCAVASLGLADISWRLIENPIRFHPWLLPRPKLSVALAGSLTLASVVFGASLLLVSRRLERTAQQIPYTNAAEDKGRAYKSGCHVEYDGTQSPDCVFGDPASKTTVVLFGDSHAAQWFPAVERIAMERHWRLLSFTKSGCPLPSIDLFHQVLGRVYTECSQWRAKTIRRIIDIRPAVVVVSDFADIYIKWGVSPQEWAEGLRRTFTRFSRAGLRTLVLRDPPEPVFDVRVCLARTAWTHSDKSCAFERDIDANADVARLEAQLVPSIPNTMLLDLSSDICTGEVCDPIRNGMIMYRDRGHLTASYSASLAPMMKPSLERLLSQTAKN